MKEFGIYNYEVFIPVMLPGSAIREKLLMQSLFIDARTHVQKEGSGTQFWCYILRGIRLQMGTDICTWSKRRFEVHAFHRKRHQSLESWLNLVTFEDTWYGNVGESQLSTYRYTQLLPVIVKKVLFTRWECVCLFWFTGVCVWCMHVVYEICMYPASYKPGTSYRVRGEKRR